MNDNECDMRALEAYRGMSDRSLILAALSRILETEPVRGSDSPSREPISVLREAVRERQGMEPK